MGSVSLDLLIVVGVICVTAMALVAVVSIKNNATIDHLARSAERYSERNDAARDRFYEKMLEKLQVQGSPEAVVKLATGHANESIRKTDGSYRHDSTIESIDEAAERRAMRRERRAEQNNQAATMISSADGMG